MKKHFLTALFALVPFFLYSNENTPKHNDWFPPVAEDEASG